LTRLDELMRRFRAHGEKAAVERVLEIARLGKRRAGDDLAQPQRWSRASARKKRKIAEWFPHLAGNPGCLL